jgi:DNA-binding NarL/FixJ family response regulator
MNFTEKETKIIVVDDNAVFRKVIKNFLQSEYNYNIIGEAACANDFFALSNLHQANIILMDLQMPEADGYFITKEILKDYNYLKVIAITMHTEKAYLNELIRVGFRGCVFKPDFYQNIQEAIASVNDNKYYFPKEIKF